MANSVNKAILIGNLGNDPVIRMTNDGKKIANLSVATSESWKDKNGEKQERTEWHRVIVFNQNLADVVEKYIKKGNKVYVSGQIQTRKYQDQTGRDCYTTEIILPQFGGELVILSGNEQQEPTNQTTAAAYKKAKDGPVNSWDNAPTNQFYDDEIPF